MILIVMSTPEGVEQARKGGLFATLCPQYVRHAAMLLEEML